MNNKHWTLKREKPRGHKKSDMAKLHLKWWSLDSKLGVKLHTFGWICSNPSHVGQVSPITFPASAPSSVSVSGTCPCLPPFSFFHWSLNAFLKQHNSDKSHHLLSSAMVYPGCNFLGDIMQYCRRCWIAKHLGMITTGLFISFSTVIISFRIFYVVPI